MNGVLWVLHRSALLKQAIPINLCVISNQHGQDDLSRSPGGFIRVPHDEVVAITYDARCALDFPTIRNEDLDRWCVAHGSLLFQCSNPCVPVFMREPVEGPTAPSDEQVMDFTMPGVAGPLPVAARTVMPHHLRHDDRPLPKAAAPLTVSGADGQPILRTTLPVTPSTTDQQMDRINESINDSAMDRMREEIRVILPGDEPDTVSGPGAYDQA